jgi:hypothetical protein
MWVLTAGLQNLRAQINEWAPDRDHTSDGTIGDAAHQAETSGHNPDDTPGSRPAWDGDPDNLPEVRAFDCDIDFRNGATAQQLVDHLRGLPGLSSVIRYMIYNRKMYHERDGFNPTPYSNSSSPHTEHIHFEGAWTQAADNNTTFDYRLEEIPVALTATDKSWIAQQFAEINAKVDALVEPTPLNGPDNKTPDGTTSTPIGHAALVQGIPEVPGAPRTQAYKVISEINESVRAIAAKVGA